MHSTVKGVAQCNVPGCGKEWPRDPVLEVECPDCHVGPGVLCKRPSEHGVFGRGFHAARDLEADRQGKYGPCPLGGCKAAMAPAQKAPAQASLF